MTAVSTSPGSQVAIDPDPRPPSDLTADSLAEAVSSVLGLWDALNIEIGETVVVTDGHPWSPLCAVVALWYGAFPVIYLTAREAPQSTVGVTTDDPARALRTLSERFAGRPAVAAIELSGRAESVDVLLESLPPSSRLACAGLGREALTIDFYNNVHRKGLRLVSAVLEPSGQEQSGSGDDERTRRHTRARQLLRDAGRASACRAALELSSARADAAERSSLSR